MLLGLRLQTRPKLFGFTRCLYLPQEKVGEREIKRPLGTFNHVCFG